MSAAATDEMDDAEAAIRRKAQELPWEDASDQRPWASRLLTFAHETKEQAAKMKSRRLNSERKKA